MSLVLLTPSMLTPFGALNVKSFLASPVATYVVPASVTVTSASSRPLSASDDGDVIDASGSTTAVTSISPVARAPLPVCPVPLTVTLSFPSSSKSPVKPSVRTASVSVPGVLLTLAILTPSGALNVKFAAPRFAAATYVVLESVTVTVAPAMLLSVRGSTLWAVIDASGSATAVTSISPVARAPLPVCPVPLTVTLSFPSSSKSPVKPSVRTASVFEVLLTPLIVTPDGALNVKSAARGCAT